MHSVIDELTGRTANYQNNSSKDIEWSKADSIKAKQQITHLYKSCALKNEDLNEKLKDLPASIQEAVINCYNIRRNHILQSVLLNDLAKTGQPIVKNIDWKVKWVLGSAKLVTISEPLLQLDLNCIQKSEVAESTVNCEMNLEQLNSFIAELERAKTELSNTS